jgi:hypothetical protein
VRDVEAAAAALIKISENYDEEAREAREIARSIFDASEICRRIMDRAL